MCLNKNVQYDKDNFTTYFLDMIQSDSEVIQEKVIKTEKDKIDSIFFDNIQHSKTEEEIKELFQSYLAFYETYYQFFSNNLTSVFLNSLQLNYNIVSENVMKMQKVKIDEIFFEKIKGIRTVNELNGLFENYKCFFEVYQLYVMEDFVMLFLNKVHSDNESTPIHVINQEKTKIDEIFFERIKNSRFVDEIISHFENYLAFFNIYHEFLAI